MSTNENIARTSNMCYILNTPYLPTKYMMSMSTNEIITRSSNRFYIFNSPYPQHTHWFRGGAIDVDID
jgi:hypothetical protein